MSDGQKVSKVLEIKGISFYEANRMCGFGQGMLDKIVKRDGKFHKLSYEKFIRTFHVNPSWWETLNGEMFLSEKKYQNKENAKNIDIDIAFVPIVQTRAQAGYMRGYSDPEYLDSLPKIALDAKFIRGGYYMVFEIEGDSMNGGKINDLMDGDEVLGKELQKHHWRSKLNNEYPWIIVHKNEGIICKDIIRHDVDSAVITCHSRNPLFEDFTLNLEDVLQLFFIVKLVGRNTKI